MMGIRRPVFPLEARENTKTSFERVDIQPTRMVTHEQYLREARPSNHHFLSKESRTEVHVSSHTPVKQHQVREQPSCGPGLHLLASVPRTKHRRLAIRPLHIGPKDFRRLLLDVAMRHGATCVEQQQIVKLPVAVRSPCNLPALVSVMEMRELVGLQKRC